MNMMDNTDVLELGDLVMADKGFTLSYQHKIL